MKKLAGGRLPEPAELLPDNTDDVDVWRCKSRGDVEGASAKKPGVWRETGVVGVARAIVLR